MLNIVQEDKEVWFAKGLSFACTGCGKCCTGAPGFVWLSPEDMKAIAEKLQLTMDEFKKRYTRLVQGRYCLTERAKNFDCVFLKENKCQIYEVRPKQCRTYPWWIQNLKSKEAWDEAKKHCEGIDHPYAPLHSCEEILKQMDRDL